jgi:hypothetical protein
MEGITTMRVLDTHEQKTPQFLVEAFPDLEIKPLAVGDYLSAKRDIIGYRCLKCNQIYDKIPTNYHCSCGNNGGGGFNEGYLTTKGLVGNLVEFKIGKDFGIHTEQLERFQDELYRMRVWQKKNPHVDLHAVWLSDMCIQPGILKDQTPEIAYDLFHHLCHQYHVWGHIIQSPFKLIELLKKLDQPKSYHRDQVYMKRTHEVAFMARFFRQIQGVSSEMAVQLAESLRVYPIVSFGHHSIDKISPKISETIMATVGWKKDGETPKKLALDIIKLLEDGE